MYRNLGDMLYNSMPLVSILIKNILCLEQKVPLIKKYV